MEHEHRNGIDVGKYLLFALQIGVICCYAEPYNFFFRTEKNIKNYFYPLCHITRTFICIYMNVFVCATKFTWMKFRKPFHVCTYVYLKNHVMIFLIYLGLDHKV